MLFKAIECYNKALIQLNSHQFTEIWESVCWEMSTCLFNMATLLQDYAPLQQYSQDKVNPYFSFCPCIIITIKQQRSHV